MSLISWVLNVGLTRGILVVNTRDKITVKTGYNSYYPMQLIDDSSNYSNKENLKSICIYVLSDLGEMNVGDKEIIHKRVPDRWQ
jgi:hypothetical protein